MEGFEEIYTLYFRDVYRYVLSLCRDSELAEELTQETFCQAMQHTKDFRGACKMTVWLCQIAKHLFFSHQKKRKRTVPLPEEHDGTEGCGAYRFGSPGEDSPMERRLLEEAETMTIHRHLHSLQEPYKEVFMLRVFGELPFQKIASIFGKTESWARVTYHRAKLKLISEMEGKP